MNQNQVETKAVAAVAAPLVSDVTISYGVRVEGAQLAFAVAMAFETLEPSKTSKTFTFADYINNVVELGNGAIAKKTVQNTISLAKLLQSKHGAKLASFADGLTSANVEAFATFMRETLAATTYRLTLDDMSRYCKGTPSLVDERKAKAEEEAKVKAALETRAAEAANVVQPLEEVVAQQEAEAEAEAESEEQAQAKQEEAARKEAEQAEVLRIQALEREETARKEAEEAARVKALAEEAEAKRKEQESFAVRVGVNGDGTPNIVVALNPSPDFLDAVAKELAKMAKALRKQQSSAMGQALTNAKLAA